MINASNKSSVEDVVIAEVVKARGIRGEVACTLYTDFPERFEELRRVTLRWPDGKRVSMELENHWFHKGRVILKFAGCETMTEAEGLVGGQLVVGEADSGSLNESEFYEYRIIGAEVRQTDGSVVGTVTSVMRTGATDLLVVDRSNKKEVLIPFADDICVTIDIDGKRITIDPPPGLLDL